MRLAASESRIVEGDRLDLTVEVSVPSEVESLEVGVAPPPGADLVNSSNPQVVTGAAGAPQSLSFAVRHRRWGAYPLGTVHLRAFDGFRLRRFEARLGSEAVVRAYPRPERLRSLIRPAHTHLYAGNRVAARKGEGVEFADIRPHAPGDQLRSVNWRASARRDGLWVNERHPERNVDVVLLLDTFTRAGPDEESTLEQMRPGSLVARLRLAPRARPGGGHRLRRHAPLARGGGRHAPCIPVDRCPPRHRGGLQLRLEGHRGDPDPPAAAARSDRRAHPPARPPLPDRAARPEWAGPRCGRGRASRSSPTSPSRGPRRRRWPGGCGGSNVRSVRARLLEAGVGIAPWAEGEPLEPVVAEVEAWRRRARLRAR